METAKIDWQTLKSVFVEDDLYEHISAPQWVDFSSSERFVDDESWFCTKDCKHPKIAEDFLKSNSTLKMRSLNMANVAKIMPLRDKNRRFLAQSSIPPTPNNPKSEKYNQDGENQNPNIHAPLKQQSSKSTNVIKPSNDETTNEVDMTSKTPWLKRTLSDRKLFKGRDVMNQITYFCHELKRLATGGRDEKSSLKTCPTSDDEFIMKEANWGVSCVLGEEKNKEKKAMLGNHKQENVEDGNREQRKKRFEEKENTPPPMDLKHIKVIDENLFKIRTNPPSPQCFSATRKPKKTSSNPSRLRTPDKRGNREVWSLNDELGDKSYTVKASTMGKGEERVLNVFWFLKPCTLSN